MGMFRYCVGGACLRVPCTSSRTRTCTTVMEPSGASDCQAHTGSDLSWAALSSERRERADNLLSIRGDADLGVGTSRRGRADGCN